MTEEHRDFERCKKCGGRCCLIYKGVNDDGSRPIITWFEEWVDSWDEEFEACGATKSGIEPLFDPLVVHLGVNEYMLKDLKEEGIDPWKCKYCGKEGCLLPWEKRPKACRTYRCREWRKEDE